MPKVTLDDLNDLPRYAWSTKGGPVPYERGEFVLFRDVEALILPPPLDFTQFQEFNKF
jgi:hypothetical protein